MARDSSPDRKPMKISDDIAFDRKFSAALGSVLESASNMFPVTEDVLVNFSVFETGKAKANDLGDLIEQLPVFAEVGSKDVGGNVGMLTDLQTASMLVGLIPTEEAAEEMAPEERDIASLRMTLIPILDALSIACEEKTGKPLGLIQKIEIIVPEDRWKKISRLRGPIYRAIVSVDIGEKTVGRIGLLLPLNLAEALAATDSAPAKRGIEHYELTELEPKKNSGAAKKEVERYSSMDNIHLILDIQLELTARLGQVEMPIGEILKLAPGSVIDIDRFADEPVELVVNDRPIARGEIVVVQENFGIRITEIASPKERIESLR